MGPVAWLAALPELVRRVVTGALAPARTAVIAAGVAAASLVPAVSAPMHVVITPAANAASGRGVDVRRGRGRYEQRLEDRPRVETGGDSSTAVPATEPRPLAHPTDGTATAATVTVPHATSSTTSPTTRPVSGANSGPGGGGELRARQDRHHEPGVDRRRHDAARHDHDDDAAADDHDDDTPHAGRGERHGHRAPQHQAHDQPAVAQTPNDTDADGNLSRSTLTVTGRSAGGGGRHHHGADATATSTSPAPRS